jgi:putative FmdB family regulatory protein
MPIYEFKCDSCGTVTERLQKMDDAPLKKCPKCGGKVEKIFSRSSFQLKGSGWYVTDYGKGTGGTAGTKKKKSRSEDEGSGSGSSSKSESSKSESSAKGEASDTTSEPKPKPKSKKAGSKSD